MLDERRELGAISSRRAGLIVLKYIRRAAAVVSCVWASALACTWAGVEIPNVGRGQKVLLIFARFPDRPYPSRSPEEVCEMLNREVGELFARWSHHQTTVTFHTHQSDWETLPDDEDSTHKLGLHWRLLRDIMFVDPYVDFAADGYRRFIGVHNGTTGSCTATGSALVLPEGGPSLRVTQLRTASKRNTKLSSSCWPSTRS